MAPAARAWVSLMLPLPRMPTLMLVLTMPNA
jgi:hypothetical protein